MNKTPIKLKPCVVKLNQLPMTPKAQQLGLSAELRNVINERNILTAKTKQRIINDLNDLNRASQADVARKNQAFQEILHTELAYVSQLEILITYFMEPIEERSLMSGKEFDIVFGNIRMLYKVHEELAEELKKNLSNLAEAFLRLAPFFKLYSVYAYNYKTALDILENLYKTNKTYANFLNIQQTRPEVQRKLTSLLIAPIQRIPRYCLLLKQVLDNSRKVDPDYKGISESLKHVRNATTHVNNHIENHAHTQRLLQLQTIIHKGKTCVIKPGRKLIKEGALKQLITKQRHTKIYCVLFTDVLLICNCLKKDLTQKHSLKVERIFPLHKCQIREDTRMKIIEIMCDGCNYNLFDDSGSKTDDWLKCIEQAIKDCINNRQTLKRDVVGSVRRLATLAKGQKRVRDTDDATIITKPPTKKKIPMNFDEIEVIIPTSSKSTHFQHFKPPQNKTTSKLFKLCSRKPITSTSINNKPSSVSCVSNGRSTDSLYPLRHQLSVDRTIDVTDEVSTQLAAYNRSDVFVFGADGAHNRGFNIANVFVGIGSSIKRLFGYN